MVPKIIFCTGVLLATLIVILLAIFSPVVHRKPAKNSTSPLMAFSLYLQQPQFSNSNLQSVPPPDALIFHRILTDGPENTSLVVGKAQGFIIPVEQFAQSAFNVIYFTFDTQEYSGSLSVQAKNIGHKDRDELTVVGGTGSFAFARGIAVFEQTKLEGSTSHVTYKIKLKLEFPDPFRRVRG
ncbi:Dirigent protein [Heracleum sosnowskyi]|uniref:Dirigent protein n=1 Tax=Heracleum sosnowskyi TaxID=360622 RepID=A0AAD8IQY2_9APIA|nr:Dirigent protein [Heracleum sosnowskyi]